MQQMLGFVVRLEVFSGGLQDLSSALRTGAINPKQVPLVSITRDFLRWIEQASSGGVLNSDPDVLPVLAGIIALKAKLLLLPKELETTEEPHDSYEEEIIEGIEVLAELDSLAAMLLARREGRAALLPARAVPIDLPRKEAKRSPEASLVKLVRAAQTAVKKVDTPLVLPDRLTLEGALAALKAFGLRLSNFSFRGVPAKNWAEQTTYFAALLEGVKEGSFEAEQEVIYGEIQIKSFITD